MFIFLMALYFLANTAGRLLIRVFTQKTKLDPYSASLAIMAPSYLIGLIYGLNQQQQPLMHGVTLIQCGFVLLFGILQVLSGKISMIAQKHIETAPYTIMRILAVPTSIITSTLLLGEALSTMQFIGMASILVGVSIVSTGGKIPHIKHIGRYELLTLLNSVFLGIYIIFNRHLIEQTSLSTLMVIFGGIEMIPLLITVATRPLSKPSKLDLKLSLGMGVSTVIHIVAFWLAVELVDNVALVSSVSAFRIVTIFIGSHIMLKENGHFRLKVTGSILATLGLLLS